MKFVTLTLEGGEDTVTINPTMVEAILGGREDGCTVVLASGTAYEVTELAGDVGKKLAAAAISNR